MDAETHNTEVSNVLFDALKPAIEHVDANMQQIYQSQAMLFNQLKQLEANLTKFDMLKEFLPLEDYVIKVTETRNRITTINSLLKRVNLRVDKMKATIRRGQETKEFVLTEEDLALLNK